MIYGIGVDAVKIERIAHSIQRKHFVWRVYSAGEQALIIGKPGRRGEETAAGCFAAKEAFLKACGLGLGGYALNEISALRRESGEPYYQLSGEAAAFCEREGIVPRLSITHEEGLAIAFAVLEKI